MQANKIYKTFSNLKFSITSYNPTWNQKVLDSFYYYFTLKKIPFLLPASIVGPSLPGGQGPMPAGSLSRQKNHGQTKCTLFCRTTAPVTHLPATK